MITNFGSSAGQYQAKDQTVDHTQSSYHHLNAIWAVQVLPAILYHSTFQLLANQLSTLSTSIEVIIFAVDSFITLCVISGLKETDFQLGIFIDFMIFGLT